MINDGAARLRFSLRMKRDLTPKPFTIQQEHLRTQFKPSRPIVYQASCADKAVDNVHAHDEARD